jgi:ribonuclease HI
MSKYYAVKKGLVPGVYSSWEECEPLVKHFPGAQYKSFKNYDAAKEYLGGTIESAKDIPSNNLENHSVVEAYSDGACSPNPGLGGWGVVVVINGQTFEYSGAEYATTNNRMELQGAINALSMIPTPSNVVVTTDSSYVCNGIIKGWAVS